MFYLCEQTEKGASAIWANNIDDKFGGTPVQIRVLQNKEPPHFHLLFKEKMIIYAGKVYIGNMFIYIVVTYSMHP
jgi:hypothetical protein